ncbi:recombinase [Dorea formicigenerans]|uniref:Recombinase n=2 Tax=Dorea formicigenerans TaxID=39486 RepID=A0A413YMV6_9FIRM|nr:recombinase [Dorea formicigenerans]RHC22658.1 recombinase [Dorea formicigenerans]
MCHIWHSNREEVRKHMIKRTISGMIGAGSLAHNRRDFVAENVDPKRTQYNICYRNENLQEVYKELFDEAVERYNVGKRNDRKITNYYEKIRLGKQEKLFHEVIFQIGNCGDMAVGTEEGELAVKILDEFLKDFEKRNPTLRLFNCYLHLDESTPHLHVDFVPYVSGWTGKGMDTKVSLKQALKSLGFPGGSKRDTELNQWINHEKEVLSEVAKKYGIEWEQKGTHEEHLDVYNFKKKERKKEVQALEQEKEYLTAENESLAFKISEVKADIEKLEDEKLQFKKDKDAVEKRAKKAETELKKLEDRREFLQPVMDNVSKEIKEYGMIKTFLPEATALERAVTYRDKKIKPLFIEMKNKIGAMAAQVKELTRERDSWKSKFQKKKQEHEKTKKELAEVQKDYQKLSSEKEILQGLADRYNRLLRMLGKDMVERLVQDDIRMQAELEAKKQQAQMPKKISDRIPWAKERSEEHNAQIKKNKAKYRGMEL